MLTSLLVTFTVLALFLPARDRELRISRVVWAALLFAVLLALVPRLLSSFETLHAPLRGVLDGREIVVDTLGFEDRRALNRATGRRRNVELEITGFLYVPRSGEYELRLACDDRCALSLDGDELLETDRRETVGLELERGPHSLALRYVQRGGPAHLILEWERSAVFPILPMEAFVFGRAEEWTGWTLSLKRLKLALVWLGTFSLCAAFLLLWVTSAPPLRRDAVRVARARWGASLATASKPEPVSRRDIAVLGGLFIVAFAVRIVLIAAQDMPILFSHPYSYYNNALRILEHPDPWSFILRSDEWRLWQSWTVAPLYYLTLAALFDVIGPELWTFRVVHAAADGVVAVAVAILARRIAGPKGVLAGVVYVFFWPAIELLNWTLTENLHTGLFMAGTVLLLRESDAPGRGRAFGAGLVLGLSALTRAVSSAFFPFIFFWRLFLRGASVEEARRNWVFAVFVAIGASVVILPWTARNVFVIGDPVLIETVSFFNLYNDNEPRREMRTEVQRMGPGAARRAEAVDVALRGIRERPDHFLRKVWINFWHFLRPDGLHGWLGIDYPEPGWRHAAHVVLGDVPLMVSIVLFFPWLFAGAPSPTRRLTLLWIGYYLLMVVVLFHNELRYRNVFFPFLFVGAAGGLQVLRHEGRRLANRAGLLLGLVVTLVVLRPYLGPALRGVRSAFAYRSVPPLLEQAALDEARVEVARAAELAGRSPRPWARFGKSLAAKRHSADAIDAYRKAGEVAPVSWLPRVVLPQLLREAGRDDELTDAIRSADRASWNADPWLMLEIAWRELPPPRTNELQVGWGDYGAVRGFTQPRGDERAREIEARSPIFQKSERGDVPPGLHRWSRGTAWIRLMPTYRSARHRLVLRMGSPYPSTLSSPEVEVRVNGSETRFFTLGRRVRDYELDVETEPGEAIEIRLDAPVWSRAGEPASQGIRVDRVTLQTR